LQKQAGYERIQFGPVRSLFKGIVWSSFPSSAAARLLHDQAAKEFLKAVRSTYVSEEIFFHSYFLNSDMRSIVVNDDLRFMDWRHRNGSVPAFLDETDAGRVLSSNALFARKMSSRVSQKLLDEIDRVLDQRNDR
jgi:hypothetical protein